MRTRLKSISTNNSAARLTNDSKFFAGEAHLADKCHSKNIVAVNGCCYGQEKVEEKGDYLKKCGQSFWSFISGDDKLYIDIIEPLGHKAKEQNEAFQVEYGKVINRFTGEFIKDFCQPDGTIIWDKLGRVNSGTATK